MTANRSLDEFGEDDRTSGTPADAGPAEAPVSAADDVPDAAEADEPTPPASTYVWTPDGGFCAACGETVEARWRDGDDLVCETCKSW